MALPLTKATASITILIVDENDQARIYLLNALRRYNEFRVISTDSTSGAAGLIRSGKIDILVFDPDLPEKKGIALVSKASAYRPETKFIAVSETYSARKAAHLKSIGVHTCLKKPVRIEKMLDAIFEPSDKLPSGLIHGISLASFLQMINLDQKTCCLFIRTTNHYGLLHCVDGEITGAQTDDLKGIKAFNRIINWENPSIEITENPPNSEKQINIPMMHLLMKSHHAIDELITNDSLTNKNSRCPVHPDDNGSGMPSGEEQYKRKHHQSIMKRLSNAPGVQEVEILETGTTGSRDIHCFSSVSAFSPDLYFSTGNSICGIAGGLLKCAVIKQSNRLRCLLLKSDHGYIKAVLEPGVDVSDIASQTPIEKRCKK